MIYLIGGPPKCGKTTLAREMSKKFKIPWLATDSLQSVAWAYTDEKEREDKFPSTRIAREVKRSNDKKYSRYSAREIVRAYRNQARAVFRAIDMMVVSEIEEQDFILEGYHIEPVLLQKLIKRYGKENIRAVFLVKMDEKEFLKGIKEGARKGRVDRDWVLARTTNPETYKKIARMVGEYSGLIEKEAVELGFRVFRMDRNFGGQIKKAVGYLKTHE